MAGFGTGERKLARLSFLAIFFFTLTSCVYWTPLSRSTSASAKVIPDVPMQKWDIKSCGAGSLSAVLQHYGDPTTMESWQDTLPKTRGGVMSIDLVLAARQRGFDARLVTGDEALVQGELRDGHPVILMLQVIQTPGKSYDFFHYVVVDGYDPERHLYRTQFGDGKARWTKFERLDSAWKGGAHAAILIRPKDPISDALRAAVQLEQDGKYALAANAYREILDQHPDSVVVWTNLGNAENQLGRRVAAEEAFRKAITLDATAADALNNLAWMLYEEKRFDEAEPIARKAVAVNAPDPWTRLDTLAHILAAKGSCDEALTTFKNAVEAVPPDQRVALEQGFADARKSCS
ncbi:MAG TPA: tetratricopeptide repeat protein [Thermoanaerobaculia bacterium]|nr:tetratricopeptide repeat protein [Thermoanaerobaculia bacterium]